MTQIPILLQSEPKVGGHANDVRQPQRCIKRHAALAADNLN